MLWIEASGPGQPDDGTAPRILRDVHTAQGRVVEVEGQDEVALEPVFGDLADAIELLASEGTQAVEDRLETRLPGWTMEGEWLVEVHGEVADFLHLAHRLADDASAADLLQAWSQHPSFAAEASRALELARSSGSLEGALEATEADQSPGYPY